MKNEKSGTSQKYRKPYIIISTILNAEGGVTFGCVLEQSHILSKEAI